MIQFMKDYVGKVDTLMADRKENMEARKVCTPLLLSLSAVIVTTKCTLPVAHDQMCVWHHSCEYMRVLAADGATCALVLCYGCPVLLCDQLRGIAEILTNAVLYRTQTVNRRNSKRRAMHT